MEEKRKQQQLLFEKLVSKYRQSINVQRDPTRLLTSTVEWRRKIFKTDDESDNVEIFPKPSDIMNIPRLCVIVQFIQLSNALTSLIKFWNVSVLYLSGGKTYIETRKKFNNTYIGSIHTHAHIGHSWVAFIAISLLI